MCMAQNFTTALSGTFQYISSYCTSKFTSWLNSFESPFKLLATTSNTYFITKDERICANNFGREFSSSNSNLNLLKFKSYDILLGIGAYILNTYIPAPTHPPSGTSHFGIINKILQLQTTGHLSSLSTHLINKIIPSSPFNQPPRPPTTNSANPTQSAPTTCSAPATPTTVSSPFDSWCTTFDETLYCTSTGKHKADSNPTINHRDTILMSSQSGSATLLSTVSTTSSSTYITAPQVGKRVPTTPVKAKPHHCN
jgi:hypothetical protein